MPKYGLKVLQHSVIHTKVTLQHWVFGLPEDQPDVEILCSGN